MDIFRAVAKPGHDVEKGEAMRSFKGALPGVIAILALRYGLTYVFHSVQTSVSTNTASCLVMLGNTTRDEQASTYIVGNIRNNCDHKIGHVTISFQVDRPAGSSVGLSARPVFAYSSEMQPGETREFKTMFPVGRNATYRYDGMTAF